MGSSQGQDTVSPPPPQPGLSVRPRPRSGEGRRGGGAGLAALTSLRGLPPSLLDILLCLVAQLDLQLLGLYLQVSLPLREGLPGLGSNDTGTLLTGPRGLCGPPPPCRIRVLSSPWFVMFFSQQCLVAGSTSQPIWGPDGSFASSSWQTRGCPQEYASFVLHPSPRRWGQQLLARSDLPGLGRGAMHSGENWPREARRRACGPAHEPAGAVPQKHGACA